jgi:hypothetical protein
MHIAGVKRVETVQIAGRVVFLPVNAPHRFDSRTA